MSLREELKKEPDARLVGAKIKVWWSGNKKFFKGTVDQYNAVSNQHHVSYEDGDEKWHALSHSGEVRAHPPRRAREAERPCLRAGRGGTSSPPNSHARVLCVAHTPRWPLLR